MSERQGQEAGHEEAQDQALDVQGAWRLARSQGVQRLDAQRLLERITGWSRVQQMARADAALDREQRARFLALLARRCAGEPLAYLLGEKEFHGLMLQVDARVLVPRSDTETLVEWALGLLVGPLGDRASPEVVDLGTGSGAIALAVKHGCPRVRMSAVDLNVEALTVAGSNAERLALSVQWHAGRWWQPLRGRRFDLVLSNPPYIAAADPHLAALIHEPRSALVAGTDGLDDLREIVGGAAAHLHAGGWLLLEHGHDQAEPVRALLAAAGFADVESRRDLAGIERCSGGRWPA